MDEHGHECYSKAMPSTNKYCEHMYNVWSVGGGTQYYPKDVGIPLGEWDSTYFVMEIHYDNPGNRHALYFM